MATPPLTVALPRRRARTVGLAATELLEQLGVGGILGMISGTDDNNASFEYRKTLYAAIIGADKEQQREAYNLGLVGYAVRDLHEVAFITSFALHPPGKADFIGAVIGALYHTFGQFDYVPAHSVYSDLYPTCDVTITAVIVVATDNFTNADDRNLTVALALRLVWVRARAIALEGLLTDALSFIQGTLHIDCINVQIFALRALTTLITAGRTRVKLDAQRLDIVRDVVRRISSPDVCDGFMALQPAAADVQEWEQLRNSLMEGTARVGVFWGAMSEL